MPENLYMNPLIRDNKHTPMIHQIHRDMRSSKGSAVVLHLRVSFALMMSKPGVQEMGIIGG